MADVKMPQLGEAVTEGTIIRWLKSEGDFVTQDEPLFEVSTDKVDSEVPSPASGVIERIIFPEGATVDVGMTLAVITRADAPRENASEAASKTDPLATIRDLASITATLGLAAHTDQITIDPELADAPAPREASAPGEGLPLLPENYESEETTPAMPQYGDPYGSDAVRPVPTESFFSEGGLADYEVETPGLADGNQDDPGYMHPDAYLPEEDTTAFGQPDVSPDEVLQEPAPEASEPDAAESAGLVVSPLVRRMAEENNLDLAGIAGSAPGGRVTRDDVAARVASTESDSAVSKEEDPEEQPPVRAVSRVKPREEADDFLEAEEIAAERLNVQPVETNVATGQDQVAVTQSSETASILGKLWNNLAENQPVAETEVRSYRKNQETTPRSAANSSQKNDERIPFTSMRRVTAEHMVRSKSIAPHAFVAREVDFEKVEQARQLLNKPTNTLFDFHVTYLPFVLSALLNVLPKYPKMNASVGRDELIVHHYINVGIVVNLEGDGMIVPVLRQADSMSFSDLVTETKKLVTRARSRSLGAEDVTNGTIAVSNQGAMGAALTFPIITQPQVAVLSIDTIKRKPTVVTVEGEEAIIVHSMGMLGLAFDARVIDTSYAAAFLRDISVALEERDFTKELGLS